MEPTNPTNETNTVVCDDVDFQSFVLTLTDQINPLSSYITTPECGVINVEGLVEVELLDGIPNTLDTMHMAVTNPEFLRPCKVDMLVPDVKEYFGNPEIEIGEYGYVGFEQNHRLWVLMVQRTDSVSQSNPLQKWGLVPLSGVIDEWAQ